MITIDGTTITGGDCLLVLGVAIAVYVVVRIVQQL